MTGTNRQAITNRLAGRLRVLIDARMLIGGFGGVSRFVTRLIDHLSRIDFIHLIALCGDESEPLENVESVRTSFSRSQRTPTKRLLWEERNLPAVIRRIQPDIYHATWNTGVPARCSVPTILTLHDLIPLHRPAEYFASWTQHHAYRYATRRALRRATHITTVSQHVADEAIGAYGIDPCRITVISNGVDPPPFLPLVRESCLPFTSRSDVKGLAPTAAGTPSCEQSRARKEADEAARTRPSAISVISAPHDPRYALYIGGHEPRKNVAGVLRAMQHYWRNLDPNLELRLTGNPEDLDITARMELDRCSAHRPSPALQGGRYAPNPSRIRFLGRINESDLSAQYYHAAALLMLSHDEGFGLPVLEAMAHGCPVIAAKRSSLPEVAGEAALLVNPDYPDEVAAAIHQLCHDPSLRQRLIDRGRCRAAQFTWQQAAARFAKLYQSEVMETRSQVVARPTPGGRTKLAKDFSPW